MNMLSRKELSAASSAATVRTLWQFIDVQVNNRLLGTMEISALGSSLLQSISPPPISTLPSLSICICACVYTSTPLDSAKTLSFCTFEREAVKANSKKWTTDNG